MGNGYRILSKHFRMLQTFLANGELRWYGTPACKNIKMNESTSYSLKKVFFTMFDKMSIGNYSRDKM